MISTTFQERRQLERLDRPALARLQLARLNDLLREVLPANPLYSAKLAKFPFPLNSLEEFAAWPLTLKDELIPATPGDDTATNLTYPLERYVRFHRTSGTRGRPLAILDTQADWQWWIDGWQFVLDAAEVGPEDRALMAFGFGPFIGFWSANDALAARGLMVIPAGGLSTLARIELARRAKATVMLCTPTYALHMAEVARENQIDTAGLGVRRIIVAGEPGGSVPAIRGRIETAWNAKLIDHSGATEVGPWGYADGQQRGLFINESQFIAEFRSLQTGEPAGEGELAELILTSLGRKGCPVIRYRTGDLVRPRFSADSDCNFVLLEGGVLGRVDDMMIIRGVNIFPSSVEQILHGFPEVVEYRLIAVKQGAMDSLTIEVEDRLDKPSRIATELQLRLGLKVEIRTVPLGSLPRFEGKGKRFIDQRT